MQSANDFLVYFNIIFKRLWLIILLFVVTVGTILGISYTAEPVYRSTVRLQVLATDSSDVSLFSTTRGTIPVDEIQQAQNDFIRALKSGFVAWRTIAGLNLEVSASDLLDGLSTAVEGEFIIVTVQSDDPGRAEAIATNQVNYALEYYRSVRATPSRVLLEFVSELLATEQQKMVDAESALLEFKQAHSVDSISQETQALQDLIRTLMTDRDQARIEQDRADIFAKIYREEEAKATAKEKEAEALETEGSSAPNTKQYYHDVALQNQATAISYEARRDGYTRSLEIYDEMIEQRTTELNSLLRLYSESNALEREFARATSNYAFLRDKQNEARLKQLQAERLGYIQISEPARKPDAPVASKTLQLVAVGGAISILAGFLLAFLIEFLGSLRQAAREQQQREQLQKQQRMAQNPGPG
jgi:uncharacterized protein involved in exopolysaccharide biosynthesis